MAEVHFIVESNFGSVLNQTIHSSTMTKKRFCIFLRNHPLFPTVDPSLRTGNAASAVLRPTSGLFRGEGKGTEEEEDSRGDFRGDVADVVDGDDVVSSPPPGFRRTLPKNDEIVPRERGESSDEPFSIFFNQLRLYSRFSGFCVRDRGGRKREGKEKGGKGERRERRRESERRREGKESKEEWSPILCLDGSFSERCLAAHLPSFLSS